MLEHVSCLYSLHDGELLDRWRSGDSESGEMLFTRHYDAIERFFVNKVATSVGDLVQDTFIACIEARDRVKDGRKLRSYLYTIAYHVLCRYLREQYQSPDDVDIQFATVQDQAPGPEWQVEYKREQRLLLEGLRHIPLTYQVIVELHYWEHLTTTEIAEILAIPVGTVRSRLRRAREMLEHAMQQLARSTAELESTRTTLQDWADQCRDIFPQ